jgi:hypothetical protein
LNVGFVWLTLSRFVTLLQLPIFSYEIESTPPNDFEHLNKPKPSAQVFEEQSRKFSRELRARRFYVTDLGQSATTAKIAVVGFSH